MLCLFVFKKLHSKSLSGSEKITWIQDKKRASLPRITGILTLRSQEPQLGKDYVLMPHACAYG